MNTQRPKANTKYRLCIDFNKVEDLVGYVKELAENEQFGERDVALRMTDGLDQTKVREVLLRSPDDVEGHPGAIWPLPKPRPDESVSDYRDRLNHEQRAVYDHETAQVMFDRG
jgi:hypothetical protein